MRGLGGLVKGFRRCWEGFGGFGEVEGFGDGWMTIGNLRFLRYNTTTTQ